MKIYKKLLQANGFKSRKDGRGFSLVKNLLTQNIVLKLRTNTQPIEVYTGCKWMVVISTDCMILHSGYVDTTEQFNTLMQAYDVDYSLPNEEWY